MKKVQGWDCRPNGDIAVGPLMSFQSAVVPMTGLVRLETAQNEGQLRSGKYQATQLALTAPQARELAAALLRMAEAIEAQPLGSAQ